MLVSFDLKNCFACQHSDHTGGFDPKGARLVCQHPSVIKCANEKGVSKKYFHHMSLLIKDDTKIPNWCPLHHGYKYQ